MLFIFYDVLQQYTSCDCAHLLFTLNILKHFDIVFKWYFKWMTNQFNANLAKKTAYYLRICSLHIYPDL